MKLFNNPIVLWQGNLSTYTFLIHQVMIRWLKQMLDVHCSGEYYVLILAILSFAITSVAAMIVQYLSKLKTKN
jgi:peptidoglycan/LPS O-acetylase OafA/YrhL